MKMDLRKPEIPILGWSLRSLDDLRLIVGISGPSGDQKSHGFCVLIFAGKDEIGRIPFKSNGEKATTHMRGALGAVLSAYEFIEENSLGNNAAKIFSKDDYVWRWLRTGIFGWIGKARRPNRDLLLKIAPMMERYAAVTLHSANEASETDIKRASDAAKDAKLGLVSAFDVEDEQDVEAEAIEFLRLRAMSRDPWK
ncbi:MULTISPECIES: hypothetical protein [Mesorhizobium]|uniref:RNase H type-1 domain-containing protein n=2 Tax=Mesorhizobium TaxID=68287 RepID=A0A1A5JKL9_RHILI|nr:MULTISPECIES: hypothetical protein [Mesorhizobium]MBE1706731.1 hypothetical protein [Mesorhizobium japonicum]MBE1714758.1 hypothetical protein [Mesorhizobium japonicum]MUT22920.1 hypothetical protein [Mesorhizobium japonicum]MUT27040.1 hypothetical protein [Mesorhizobium japonicum]OBP80655.1 hypothetical protein BAE42_03230 [Mesorhizobium loti]